MHSTTNKRRHSASFEGRLESIILHNDDCFMEKFTGNQDDKTYKALEKRSSAKIMCELYRDLGNCNYIAGSKTFQPKQKRKPLNPGEIEYKIKI